VSQNPYQSPMVGQPPKKRMTWLEVVLLAAMVVWFAVMLAWIRIESRKSAERDNRTHPNSSAPVPSPPQR
jgi:hypothetical protein